MFGAAALERVLKYPFDTVLDIGSGPGHHAQAFDRTGKIVTTIDLQPSDRPLHIQDHYMRHEFERSFDCVWCCHVLEHQPNVHSFLRKVREDLRVGGVLAITVPPRKDEIVGGHVTLWNAGLLLYNLILAGFDCSDARVAAYGYNISVIVQRKDFELPPLAFDSGDINRLSPFFPFAAREAFNGVLPPINW